MIKNAKFEVIFYMLFAVIVLVMFARVFFGLEITDEAYYMAEGRTVLEGNLPYALNNSNAVGMTLLMIPFVWVFRLFSPEYVGYFLYMRICFVIFKSILVLICYFLLRKKVGKFYAACIALFMCSFQMYSIQNFSYNTISTLMIFIVGVLLYSLCDVEDYDVKYREAGFFFAGFLSAIAVFSHPAHAISVLLFLIFLFVFRTKIREILFYMFGGIVQIVVLFVPVIAQSGFNCLVQGLTVYWKNIGGIEKPGFKATLESIWGSCNHLWKIMFAVFILSFCIGLFINGRMMQRGKSSFVNSRQTIRNEALNALFPSMIIGLLYVFLRGGTQYVGGLIGACGSFVIVIFLILFTKKRVVWFLGVPSFCFCLFELFSTTTSGPMGRFLHVFPSICTLFIIFSETLQKKNQVGLEFYSQDTVSLKQKGIKALYVTRVFVLPAIVTLAIIICEIHGLEYVYRDAPLPELTYRVKQGLYKGIYTTEQNANDTIELENYLKEITEEEDWIAFRDNVPVGYLFMNGRICDIRTWDCMQYSYGINDPSALYAYYERADRIPDKIIYIDFERDEKLSIDTEDYLYNTFVEENYILQSDVNLNDTYKRVVLYRRKSL